MIQGLRTVVYHVDDLAKAGEQYLLELGAREHAPPREVGGGIVVATVTDPFGNVFGVIENPHFKAGGE